MLSFLIKNWYKNGGVGYLYESNVFRYPIYFDILENGLDYFMILKKDNIMFLCYLVKYRKKNNWYSLCFILRKYLIEN